MASQNEIDPHAIKRIFVQAFSRAPRVETMRVILDQMERAAASVESTLGQRAGEQAAQIRANVARFRVRLADYRIGAQFDGPDGPLPWDQWSDSQKSDFRTDTVRPVLFGDYSDVPLGMGARGWADVETPFRLANQAAQLVEFDPLGIADAAAMGFAVDLRTYGEAVGQAGMVGMELARKQWDRAADFAERTVGRLAGNVGSVATGGLLGVVVTLAGLAYFSRK